MVKSNLLISEWMDKILGLHGLVTLRILENLKPRETPKGKLVYKTLKINKLQQIGSN
jgi:hypothetical protein